MAAQNVTQFLQGIGANNLEQVGQFLQNMQGQVQAAEQRAASLQDTFNQQQDVNVSKQPQKLKQSKNVNVSKQPQKLKQSKMSMPPSSLTN